MKPPAQETPRSSLAKLFMSAVFGMIGGLLTIAMVGILDSLINLIWVEGFGYDLNDPSRGYAQLVLLLIVGLTVGLLAKRYGPSKGSIETVIEESLEAGKIDWRGALKSLGIGILSIGSGASLGPEAPAAMLSGGLASYIAEKSKASVEMSRVLNLSAVSGMLGSLLSTPFVSTAMFIEFSKGKLSEMRSIISYSFVAGSFGVATFFVIFHKLYASSFGIPTLEGGPSLSDLLWAFALGILGAIFTVIAGLIMQAVEPFFVRLDKQLVLRSIVGAAIAGIIALILPLTMFSGQHTITTLQSQAAALGTVMLFVLALAKLTSTLTLLRTGFFGGPIFPAVFAGSAFGLAVNSLVHISPAVAMTAAIAGVLTVSLRRPLSAALITLAIAGATNATVIALGVSASMLMVVLVEQRLASAKV